MLVPSTTVKIPRKKIPARILTIVLGALAQQSKIPQKKIKRQNFDYCASAPSTIVKNPRKNNNNNRQNFDCCARGTSTTVKNIRGY